MSSGFWQMGGYAQYVWPCFVAAALLLGWNLWSARRYLAAAKTRAARAIAMSASESR